MITLKQIQVEPSRGLKQTLFEMSLLEKKSFENVEFVTWVFKTFNSNCTACLPGKIWHYMQHHFQYKKDEPHDEVLIAPYLMPSIKAGDCDDFSLFAKTCMDILQGWSNHYLLLGVDRNRFTHIVVFSHRGLVGLDYVDPVVIDGVNKNFNLIPTKYNYYKIL